MNDALISLRGVPFAAEDTENMSYETLEALLQATLERLGFVFPDDIQKNEATVSPGERAALLARWRHTYRQQLMHGASALIMSSKLKENSFGLSTEKAAEALDIMVEMSVKKMEWLLDHRHIVGLFNDQCNAKNPLPTTLKFTSAKAAESYIQELNASGHMATIAENDSNVIHVPAAVFVAPTYGPQSIEIQYGLPVVRILSGNDDSLVRIPTHYLQSAVAKSSGRHFAFYNPYINYNGSQRDEKSVQMAQQLFSPTMKASNNLLSDSLGFIYEKGI